MKKKFLMLGLVAVVAAGSLFAQRGGTAPISGGEEFKTRIAADGMCIGQGNQCTIIWFPDLEL